CREPPQVGRAPRGWARGAASVAEPKGLETAWGVWAITEGLCTRPGAIAPGCILDLGDRDCSASPCASAARQGHSVPAVGFHPLRTFWGMAGGRHPPAVVVFFRERRRAPGATGARLRDKDAVCGLRLPLTDEVIEGTRAGPTGAQGGDLGAMLWGDSRHGH